MSHHRRCISTAAAPKAIGPYSQAVTAGNLVFVSGQLGFDPETMTIVDGGIREQTRRSLMNLSSILAEAGCALGNVTACTVYLKDMNDFPEMNDVYATFFPSEPPSRAAIEVARLPKDGLVEISCIAVIP